MVKDTVLIVTGFDDAHADSVIRKLDAREVPVFRLHPAELPGTVRISLEVAGGSCLGSLAKPGRKVSFDQIGSAWYRRPREPVPAPGTDPRANEYVVRQCTEMLSATYAILGSVWVGEPDRLRRAEIKALQLLHAEAAGLTVPRTLFGNSREELERFRDEILPERCAIKPLQVVATDDEGGRRRFPMTAPIEPGQPLAGVELAPSILQPYVEKEFELRCVAIGERIFTAAIHSQEHPETEHDWRLGDARLAPYELPAAVADSVRSLLSSFDLDFASIDMVVTPDGDHVFLDLNPTGGWLWLEHQLELPLSEAFADLLCAGLDRTALGP